MDFLVKKKTVTGMVIACLLLLGLVSQVMAGDEGSGKSFYKLRTLEVKMTNLTRDIILTPPIFATSRKPIHFYALAQPAEKRPDVFEVARADFDIVAALGQVDVDGLGGSGHGCPLSVLDFRPQAIGRRAKPG